MIDCRKEAIFDKVAPPTETRDNSELKGYNLQQYGRRVIYHVKRNVKTFNLQTTKLYR